MIVVGVVVGTIALAVLVWRATRYYPSSRSQHGGAAEGAVSVQDLAERVDAEISSGADCRQQRGLITMRGDLADDLANEQTRILALPPDVQAADPDELARNPLVLHRVLAGVRRL